MRAPARSRRTTKAKYRIMLFSRTSTDYRVLACAEIAAAQAICSSLTAFGLTFRKEQNSSAKTPLREQSLATSSSLHSPTPATLLDASCLNCAIRSVMAWSRLLSLSKTAGLTWAVSHQSETCVLG